MNQVCRIANELNAHEIAVARSEHIAHYSEADQRSEAIALADQFKAGRAALNDCWGNDYPLTELMVSVWDHELYEAAFFKAANGNSQPIQDLILRCARHAAAVHLFGEDRADELGFLS